MKTQLKMIDEFQCPGCIYGINTADCPSFKLKEEDGSFHCEKHHPSTFMSGVGRILLGLPKGFNRAGPIHDEWIPNLVRLFENSGEPIAHYNRFNVPVWAMEKDGFLFVRCYAPRVNKTWIDVIQGGKISDLPSSTIDISEFLDDMD